MGNGAVGFSFGLRPGGRGLVGGRWLVLLDGRPFRGPFCVFGGGAVAVEKVEKAGNGCFW